MTPSRKMTRQKVHPRTRACLAAAVAGVPDLQLRRGRDRPRHAAVARGLLGPAEDPLREAKEELGRRGPLSSNLRA
jgi:hypothetical protein